MKFFYSLLLLLVVFKPVFAQKNFQPGYLVTLQGDTIRGTIDTREWNKNPKSVSFKNPSGKVEIYTALTANGFGVTNETDYSKYAMQISIDDILPDKLSITPKYTTDTLFLRRIITGKHLTLYDYTDEIKTRYIIVDESNRQPRELAYHILADSLTSNEIIKTTAYRNQLAYYANLYAAGNANIQRQISNAGYGANLVQIVNLINGGNDKLIADTKKSGFRFYAGASANIATLKYSGLFNEASKSFNFIAFNAGIDVFQNAKIGATIFRIEAGFVPYHAIESKQAVTSGDLVTFPNSTQQQQIITLSPQIIYNIYNTASFKAFVNSGLTANLLSYKNSSNNIEMSPFGFNVPFGAGVTLSNKLQIQATYNTAINVVKYLNWSESMSVIKIGINYLLPINTQK